MPARGDAVFGSEVSRLLDFLEIGNGSRFADSRHCGEKLATADMPPWRTPDCSRHLAFSTVV